MAMSMFWRTQPRPGLVQAVRVKSGGRWHTFLLRYVFVHVCNTHTYHISYTVYIQYLKIPHVEIYTYISMYLIVYMRMYLFVCTYDCSTYAHRRMSVVVPFVPPGCNTFRSTACSITMHLAAACHPKPIAANSSHHSGHPQDTWSLFHFCIQRHLKFISQFWFA